MALRTGDLVVCPSYSFAFKALDAEAVAASQHLYQSTRLGRIFRVGVDAAGSADQTLAEARPQQNRCRGRNGRRRG